MIKAVTQVLGKRTWDGLDVWPVKGLLGDMHYYEADTGLLAGAESIGGRLKMVLIDTNEPALKAALPKQ